MSAKHTPTPWTIDGNDLIGPSAVYIIKDYGDYDGMKWMDWGDVTEEQCEANKQFIVRAVNNHDALVEQLEIAADFADQVAVIEEMEKRERTARTARRYANQFRAAIAKAGAL